MLPVLFHIGNFPVRSWGLLLMVGFLAGTWWAARNARRYGIAPEDVWDISLVGLFGGVVGARLFWVAQNLPYIARHPQEIAAVWTGGMTFYGGLFGGILAGMLMCRRKKVNMADMADLAGLAFPIGYFFGRIGCFLNGCCYGGECDLPWGTRFHLPNGTMTPPSHPAQLYAAVAAVIMFLVLRTIERRRAFPGQVILSFVGLYAIYRFFIEFVREGATADLAGIAHLTVGQVFSLGVAVAVAVWYVLAARRPVRSTTR
ncbi:MAG: prolipoprotein diacylglyceryl transferase [Capsulimonadales bacterium]|nr:prolipoprotein diacylglyceryl transferase [Capsulimonadales bacterium]